LLKTDDLRPDHRDDVAVSHRLPGEAELDLGTSHRHDRPAPEDGGQHLVERDGEPLDLDHPAVIERLQRGVLEQGSQSRTRRGSAASSASHGSRDCDSSSAQGSIV